MIGFSWILRYAAKVKKNPKASLVYEEDQYWRDLHNNNSLDVAIIHHVPPGSVLAHGSHTNHFRSLLSCNNFTNREQRYQRTASPPHSTAAFILTSLFALRKTVHLYILNLLFFTIFYLITGVMGYGWYIMEIATLFFALGLAAGIANNRIPTNWSNCFWTDARTL